jgi:thiamine biosynthesis protein ThiS
MMEITLNNRKEVLEQENVSVAELIILKNLTFKMLVTKVNGKLVRKEERDQVFIKDGDDVTVMHLISGG